RERRASGGKPVPLSPDEVLKLPNGAVVEVNRAVFAALDGRFVPWNFHGYGTEVADFAVDATVQLVTPASTVAALAICYQPICHASPQACLRRLHVASSYDASELQEAAAVPDG